MARWTKEETFGAGLLVVGGGLLLYYLKAGAGSEKNAALIPDTIEKKLDMVVDKLNRKFNKRWGNLTIAALSAALPKELVGLVNSVVTAEQVGKRMGWTGPQKHKYAVGLATA